MLYNRVVDDPNYTFQPRTFLFGAKASPGYYRAKLIIRLINAIAQLVEKHPRARKLMQGGVHGELLRLYWPKR